MTESIFKTLNIKKAVYIGLLLTVILTWPTAWHFFTGIPGRGADTYQAIARTNMVEKHIEEHGWNETFHWQKDVDFWGILPILGYTQAVLGSLAGYNFWWLLSFFLAFLGMWLFVKDISGSDWAAGVSGFIFAFMPFHFAQATATNIGTMHYEWLAWLAFFLHRFMRSTSWRSAVGVAVSILFIIAVEHQLLAFTIIFLIFYFPFLVFCYPQNLKRWRFWVAIIAGLIVLFGAGAIQFNKIWEIAHSNNNFLEPPYSQVEDYSADLIDFLIPARFQTFWGENFNHLRDATSSNPEGRQTFFLGYLAILLALFGLFKTLKKKVPQTENEEEKSSLAENYVLERRWSIFWLLISLVFILLSLGPSLHLQGNIYLEKKLPYFWLYSVVPYWNYIRTSSRVFVIAALGWAFLAGLEAKYLEEYREPFSPFDRKSRLEKKAGILSFLKAKNGSPLVSFALIFLAIGLPLEYLSIPVQSLDLSYSRFYDELAKNKDKFSILEVPGSTSYDFGSYSLYTASIHEKNKVDGIDFARTEKDRWVFQRNTPVIENLLYSLPTGGQDHEESSGGDIINSDYTPFGAAILNFYGIRYVTLSKVQTGNKFGSQEFQNTAAYAEEKLGLSPTYEDSFLKAYSVPQDKKQGYFLALDMGANESWGPKEGTGSSRGRNAADGAKMRLVNLGQAPIDLQINFQGKIKYTHYVEVLLDGKTVKTIFMNEFKGDYFFITNQLTPGEHTIEFKISDDKHQPAIDYSQDRSVKFSHFETVQK